MNNLNTVKSCTYVSEMETRITTSTSVCWALSPLHTGTMSILQQIKQQKIPLKFFKPFELPVRQRLAQKVNINQEDNQKKKPWHNEILKTKVGKKWEIAEFSETQQMNRVFT